jgi:hypothetical protein
MEYVMTNKEKRRQQSLPFQLWRLMVLSTRFMKLVHVGERPAPAKAREGANRHPAHPA